ncbi:MAG TPA: PIN domain-containing protein [Gaiellaceae bacterium]|nr:PIN domain-containing protein [Gaiellaceae bacterium]
MSADRAFVDTNVLVYAVDTGEPAKRGIARTVLAERADLLVLSAQVLAELYVVTTRKLAVPLSEDDGAGYVEELSGLPIVAIDAELVLDGIRISRQAQLSFWDGLIVAAARAGGCGVLLTEDLAAGSTIAGVAVENPFVE